MTGTATATTAEDRRFVQATVRYFVDLKVSTPSLEDLAEASHCLSSWRSVLKLFRLHGSSSIAYTVLSGPGVSAACSVPAEALDNLRVRYTECFHQAAVEPRILREVVSELDSAGIQSLAVKGLVLGCWLYDDPALREHMDLDLIVAESQVHEAEGVLVGMGYRPLRSESNLPQISNRESLGSMTFTGGPSMPAIDLSFDPLRLFWKPAAEQGAWFEAWWVRRMEVTVGGRPLLTMGPEDQFIYLARHLQFHDYFRMNWYIDLLLLLARCGADIDWPLVGQLARTHRLEGGLYRSLELVSHAFGNRFPNEAWELLRPNVLTRSLHRRAWPDELSVPRDAPSHGGSPMMPRYIGLSGSHPVMATAILMLHRDRRANLNYLVRRYFPTYSWLRSAYGSNDDLGKSRLALLKAHWRHLRVVKANVA